MFATPEDVKAFTGGKGKTVTDDPDVERVRRLVFSSISIRYQLNKRSGYALLYSINDVTIFLLFKKLKYRNMT